VCSKQSIVSRLTARFYPYSQQDALDAAFCTYAKPGMRILDAGCGGERGCSREAPWQRMHIIGVDMDPAVLNNPFCNEKFVCDISNLPFHDSSFDIIHCRWVLEHLVAPLKVFREFARVLKPNGHLLALTPNIFHYATIAARLTPHWFHRCWLKDQGDTFKVYYRANNAGKLKRLCAKTGFKISRLEFIEIAPYYLERFLPGFLCGIAYERITNSTIKLKHFRQRILLEATLLVDKD
jgi:SAM-dependent methyltransferase